MDKLAIYLRLSLEDTDDKDESNSISSQRAMLHAYIRGNEELRGKEVLEFCEIKLAYLIQRERAEYRGNRRNKGIWRYWIASDAFFFLWVL